MPLVLLHSMDISMLLSYIDIIKLLLSDPRVDPRAEDSEAFRRTIETFNFEAFELFIKDGRADFSSCENYAISTASFNVQTKFVDILWNIPSVKKSLKNDDIILHDILLFEETRDKIKEF